MPQSTGAAGQAAPQGIGWKVALVALAPFGLGYFLSYFFRAVNAIVAPDLMRDLRLDAGQLGFLTAAYLLAFSVFQLPLGILLDRYGPRRVQAALLAVAALGAVIFSLGEDVTMLTIGRALIGLGFAGGLMASFKAVVVWVSEPRRAFANAAVMSSGGLGLMVSTAPVEWAVAHAGWRAVFAGLGAITALAALIIFTVVPRPDATGKPAPLKAQLGSLVTILKDPAFLRMAPLLGLSAGTQIAVQTLWAGPWWRDVGGMDRAGVARSLLLMAAAFFVGILGSGAVADRLVRRGISILNVMLAFMLMSFLAQALILLDLLWLPAWLLFAMMGQVAILAFPWLSSYFGAALSGRATSAMNLMIFIAAFVAQWGIGAIIDLYPKAASGGFTPEAYRAGFGAFLALQVVGLLIYLPGHRRMVALSKG